MNAAEKGLEIMRASGAAQIQGVFNGRARIQRNDAP